MFNFLRDGRTAKFETNLVSNRTTHFLKYCLKYFVNARKTVNLVFFCMMYSCCDGHPIVSICFIGCKELSSCL